ncbi:MAG: heavy metal sensor histidine kinase [Verrucomicrobia bacterium]|nr:heavy metal sensor histidine kinase [Verrucomicrobiota bacterium]
MAPGTSSKPGSGLRSDILKRDNRPRKSWSIVVRLAFWYTALSTGVLCAAGVYLALALQRSLDVEAKHLVADKIAVLRQIVRERPTDRDALEEEVAWESSARREAVYYARLLLRDRTIVESPGFKAALPNKVPFPDPAPIDAEVPTLSEFTTGTGSRFLLAAADVAGPAETGPFRYEVALDISKQQMLLRSFERKLLVAIGLAALVSAGLSTWIARRGTKPLQAIANAARSVRAGSTNARIGSVAWPRELQPLAEEFDEMLDRLEDSFSRLSRFSANIAHELKTPLSNLSGEAELALRRQLTGPAYREVLASNLEECQRLGRLIDSLLFLARVDSDEFRLQQTEFSAGVAAQDVVDFYEALATEQQISLGCSGDAVISGNEALFKRALGNLIDNALHAVRPGGCVSVEIKASPSCVVIQVKDDGEGIDPAALPRIFERFYRAQPGRPGSGLGLSIVQSIMQLHGGSVTASSELGIGTEIALRFPAAKGAIKNDKPVMIGR